jgi:hypothetical protein
VPNLSRATPGIKGDDIENSQFGIALAAGDFGKTGPADLQSAPGMCRSERESADVAHVIYGSSTGLTAAGDQPWNRDTPDILGEAGTTSGPPCVSP